MGASLGDDEEVCGVTITCEWKVQGESMLYVGEQGYCDVHIIDARESVHIGSQTYAAFGHNARLNSVLYVKKLIVWTELGLIALR